VKKAEAEKLKVMEVAEAAKWADVMMMLTPTSCRPTSTRTTCGTT
jgi:ketol-acid reductoisomerase